MNGDDSTSSRQRQVKWGSVLLIVVLIAYPIVGGLVINLAGDFFQPPGGIIVGLFILAGFFLFLRYLYRWADRVDALDRTIKRERYRGVYRVKALPVSSWTWNAENIQIGDYGWEMEPWRTDELIYLHGLEEQWGVVWMAGFRREDAEYVAPKPVSEYDWKEFDYDGPKPRNRSSWGSAKAKSPCPFAVAVQNRPTVHHWQFS